MKNTNTTTKKAYFTNDVLTSYEKAIFNAFSKDSDLTKIAKDPQVMTTLQATARFTVFSVLKKLFIASGNKIPQKMTRDICKDLDRLDRLDRLVTDDHVIIYDDDGDPTVVYNELSKDTYNLLSQTLSDGADLLSTASLAVWTETVKIIQDRPADLELNFMTVPYKQRILRKKVYIKDDPTDPTLWTDTDITPIQQAYKSVRREIIASKALQTNNKFVYIEDLAVDPCYNDNTETIYKRLDKTTASLTTDTLTVGIDGRPTEIPPTASITAVKNAKQILTELNLTARQATVLKYRLQGYGKQAIATRLKIGPSSVADIINNIRKKTINLATRRPDLLDPSIIAKITK